MKAHLIQSFKARKGADVLVIPFWEDLKEAHPLPSALNLKEFLKLGDFKGKSQEISWVYEATDQEPRLLLLGLGAVSKVSSESLRRSFGSAVRASVSKKIKKMNLLIPSVKGLQEDIVLKSVIEGALLANYTFSKKQDTPDSLDQIYFIGSDRKQVLEDTCTLIEGVCYVRDLVNENADTITPQRLAEEALGLEKISSLIKTIVFDKKRIEKEQMGLLLAVNRASHLDPAFIQIFYQGGAKGQPPIVLVGKGVTYDTGGLSLKPTDGMLSMKCDMSGAATVLGTLKTAALLGLKLNLVGVIPATENGIGPKSYKLGDVYRSYQGKTVEINNTDAEGRLILADALSYAAKNLNPSCMIDLATLTGAIVVALGEEIAGLFVDQEGLASDLLAASASSDEAIWRMPLNEDYKDALKSDLADLINSGGRSASSVTAALFLKEFTGSVPWAHLDIAGPAFLSKPKYYHSTKATGFGVRLLIDFLKHRSAAL